MRVSLASQIWGLKENQFLKGGGGEYWENFYFDKKEKANAKKKQTQSKAQPPALPGTRYVTNHPCSDSLPLKLWQGPQMIA